MTQPDETGRPSLGPRLPCTLGRFTLCRELGAGGMATVYLSKMRLGAGLDRLVALKTIHAHLAKQQTFVDMFLDEAKIASHISHPNVCSVYDFGREGDVYFLAMEYLVGEPLFDFINQVVAKRNEGAELMQALPFLAARILADACEGLHAAHTATGADGNRLDIVHRDVSPQNLFLTYDGTVKVVDFGCAKALERVTQTNTGIMKGKVSYAAPEQLRDEPVDARTDVFALGACLWETLTLRQLFRRDTAIKTAMAVLEEPIPPADATAPWVPEELADIAERALQRSPRARYPTARAMGRALRGFIAKSGAPFESAELAEWMRYLFEDRYDQTLAMVANVEALELPGDSDVRRTDATPARPRDSGVTRAPRLSLDEDLHPKGRDTAARSSKGPALLQQENDIPAESRANTGRWLIAAAMVATVVGFTLNGDYREPFGTVLEWFTGADSSDGHPADAEPDALRVSQPVTEAPSIAPATDRAPVLGDDELRAPTDRPANPPTELPADPVDPPARRRARETGDRPRRRGREERTASDEGLEDDAYEPPAQVTGDIRIVADDGWAQIEHEGRSLGHTPLRVTLPAGRQRLRVLPAGQGPGETITVTVEPGTLRTLHVQVDTDPNAPGPS